jgi:serine/threonine protein phosphatase PrpC
LCVYPDSLPASFPGIAQVRVRGDTMVGSRNSRSNSAVSSALVSLEAVCSEQGRRPSNQDFAFAGTLPNPAGKPIRVACVADGVGSGAHGREAAILAVEGVRRLVTGRAISGLADLQAVLPAWVNGVNREIQNLAQDGTRVNTTLTACLATEGADRLMVVHLGDSRAYIVGNDACHLLTRDHTDANEALHRGVDEDLLNGEDYRSLARCLGTGFPDAGPDVFEQHVETSAEEGYWVVVSSDGMHGKVPAAILTALARGAGSARELADDLVRWSLLAGTRDNSSVAVLRFGTPRPVGQKPDFPDPPKTDTGTGVRSGRGAGRRKLLPAIAGVLVLVSLGLGWYGVSRREDAPLCAGVSVLTNSSPAVPDPTLTANGWAPELQEVTPPLPPVAETSPASRRSAPASVPSAQASPTLSTPAATEIIHQQKSNASPVQQGTQVTRVEERVERGDGWQVLCARVCEKNKGDSKLNQAEVLKAIRNQRLFDAIPAGSKLRSRPRNGEGYPEIHPGERILLQFTKDSPVFTRIDIDK